MQETQEMWVRSLGQEEPWSRTWQPTPIFFTGKFHGQRSLAGRSPYGSKELDLTEHTERRGICSLSFDWNRFFFFFLHLLCTLFHLLLHQLHLRSSGISSQRYRRTLLFIHSIYNSLHLLTPTTHSIPRCTFFLDPNPISLLRYQNSRTQSIYR